MRAGTRAVLPAVLLALAPLGCADPTGAPPAGPSPSPAGPSTAPVDPPAASVAPAAPGPPTAPGAPAAPVLPAPFGTAADALPAARLEVRGPAVTLELHVRVAETPEDQARGLQGVEDLPEGTGMLFLFQEDHRGGFWMRDTLVPLDIAFLDGEGRVLAVAGMTPCVADPCPLTDPGVPYRAALEVGAGVLAGVAEGDLVTWERSGGR